MSEKIKITLTEHMRDFGLHMIAKGVVNATFNEMTNPYSHAMSVVHVAHGTEILIKARIAEEHPLLIFSKIPSANKSKSDKLEFVNLLEHGQTILYSELPDRLWAVTGYQLKNIDLYNEFGRIRNQIIHLAIPDIELSDLTLRYALEVIEPAINEWWDDTLLEYATNYDDCYLEYAFERFDTLGIKVNYRLDEHFNLIKK